MEGFWNRRKRARRQRTNEELERWYHLCVTIADLCGNALYDEDVLAQDIGAILDHIDRTIFRLHDQRPSLSLALRRQFPGLSNQIRATGKKVIQLRNATALFLIHLQGPTPLQRQTPEMDRPFYYQQALEKYGFQARQLWEETQRELRLTRQTLDEVMARWG